MQKKTVRVTVSKRKKNRKDVNFKTQDDKMIYFPMCEKLAMNKLLTFKSALLN